MLSISKQPVTGANRAEWDADAKEDGRGPWRSDRGGRKGVKDRNGRQLPHQVSLIHLNRQGWSLSPEKCVLISRGSVWQSHAFVERFVCVWECQREFEKEVKKQVLPQKGTDSEETEIKVVCEKKKEDRIACPHCFPPTNPNLHAEECCTHLSSGLFTSGFTLKTEKTTTWH